jgi:hypothetical protein
MRNYSFRYYSPYAIRGAHGEVIPIPEVQSALDDLADFISISGDGIPTHEGTEINSNVYSNNVIQTARAQEPIFTGAALNVYYRNGVVNARLAINSDPARYCNAISFSDSAEGEPVKIKTGTVYTPFGLHPVVSNGIIWLSSTPGSFTSNTGSALGAIVQPCGYSLSNNSIYFQYNNPTLTS